MNLKFPPPLADARDYPAPRITAMPEFQFQLPDCAARNSKSISAFLKNGYFTNSGRTALALAAQALGIESGSSILLPAYHCPGLVEPFIWMGNNVLFYHLHDDLSVDLEDFQNKITPDTKACLFVRFFGFALNLSEAIQLARSHGLLVIEDDAHTVVNLAEDGFPTLRADAAICSLNKCYSVLDGGALIFKNKHEIILTPRSYTSELKAILRLTGGDTKLSWLFRLLRRRKKHHNHDALASNLPGASSFEYRYFQAGDLNKQCYRYTRWVTKTTDLKKIYNARRKNYIYLLNKLTHSNTGRPLYPELPDYVCPYVFPFLLNSELSFQKIRKLGVQILRWEEVAASDCQVSQAYRARLIQVPCHQNLSVNTLDEIVLILNSSNIEN